MHTPSEISPSDIVIILIAEEPNSQKYQAAKLAQDLIAAGLSRYEPNPLAALAQKK